MARGCPRCDSETEGKHRVDVVAVLPAGEAKCETEDLFNVRSGKMSADLKNEQLAEQRAVCLGAMWKRANGFIRQ